MLSVLSLQRLSGMFAWAAACLNVLHVYFMDHLSHRHTLTIPIFMAKKRRKMEVENDGYVIEVSLNL